VKDSAGKRPLVVLVEDDAQTRGALEAILDLEGYDVSACHTAAALISRLRFEAKPAVVILDLTLPDASGGRCLRAIRASSWADVPVLILSAWGHLERFGLDADQLLSKTCDPVTIARAVDRLARRHPSSSTRRSDQPSGSRT